MRIVISAGNDICKDAKRQIISIEDIFTALEDLEFQELVTPLKESLEGKS
jgi:DNA polymerase epsilon subunit 3